MGAVDGCVGTVISAAAASGDSLCCELFDKVGSERICRDICEDCAGGGRRNEVTSMHTTQDEDGHLGAGDRGVGAEEQWVGAAATTDPGAEHYLDKEVGEMAERDIRKDGGGGISQN